MDYPEALKKVRAEKTKENFVLVEIETDYRNRLVLTNKDAVALLAALSNAEQLHKPFSEPHRIIPLGSDSVKTYALSHADYEDYKVAALLGVTVDELKKSREGTSP